MPHDDGPDDDGPDAQEGMRVEFGDLDRVQQPREHESSAESGNPLGRRSATRRRLSGLVVLLAICLLAVVLVVANLPLARSAVLGDFARPTPTATLTPGADEFYLVPNPPGVSVLLDGRALHGLPVPGTPPIHLSLGRHTFVWTSGSYPFKQISCIQSSPPAGSDTCATAPGLSLPATAIPAGVSPIYLTVIQTHDALSTLRTGEDTALTSAIQAALDRLTASATVATGERYYGSTANGGSAVLVASQPLRATLRLVLRGVGAPSGCSVPSPGAIQPCRAPGQNCSAICTLTDESLELTPRTWIAGVIVSAAWTYTTLSGQPVAQNVGDPGLNASLAVMAVSWDGSRWTVLPLIGHRGGAPEADDALCDSARNWLASGPLASLLPAADATQSQHVAIQYASSEDLTDGCVVAISGYGQSGATSAPAEALFLERFGVLVAVNAAAHALWPGLPTADAAELADATALANSANISH